MLNKRFSKNERDIIHYLNSINEFEYKGKRYLIRDVGKPTVASGEPKTDIYFCLLDVKNNKKEFKISLKMKNADFLENKIKLERAKEIFGANAQKVIYESCIHIKNEFYSTPLVDYSVNNRSKSPLITLGWKFELMNKKSGKKSGKVLLSDKQKFEVFSGETSENNRTAAVNGKIIKNSGIANYFLEFSEVYIGDINLLLDNVVPLINYSKNQEIYFACKALNYRVEEDKWDGNRPLAVWVDWELFNNLVVPRIIFDKPLETTGNHPAEKVKRLLSLSEINLANFQKCN